MQNSKSTENSVICIQQDREKLTGDWIQAEASEIVCNLISLALLG
jgi:hypothetical protein